mmetsp:Transcript_14492/g.36371  ORF Transcript_14492/g.36371 Transcript_14492/m.36371 type:complete len:243 (+) Transcript_14492:255-983(+)
MRAARLVRARSHRGLLRRKKRIPARLCCPTSAAESATPACGRTSSSGAASPSSSTRTATWSTWGRSSRRRPTWRPGSTRGGGWATARRRRRGRSCPSRWRSCLRLCLPWLRPACRQPSRLPWLLTCLWRQRMRRRVSRRRTQAPLTRAPPLSRPPRRQNPKIPMPMPILMPMSTPMPMPMPTPMLTPTPMPMPTLTPMPTPMPMPQIASLLTTLQALRHLPRPWHQARHALLHRQYPRLPVP